MINDVGSGIKGTVKNISNVIGGIGKALGFGWKVWRNQFLKQVLKRVWI